MTGESAPCPVPSARMKPQRPHVHRFRFERPEGFVSRGRCGCGAFRAAWADGMGPNGLSKRPGRETPVSVLRERNVEAWAAGEVPRAPCPVPSAGTLWERAMGVLKARAPEFVDSTELGALVYGDGKPPQPRVGGLVLEIRGHFGRKSVVNAPGKGYAWRGE